MPPVPQRLRERQRWPPVLALNPDPVIAASAITSAVKLAAIKGNPSGRSGIRQRLYIELALGIAEGRYM